MKKDQEELSNIIKNILSTLSSEYIIDLFLPNYHTLVWHNLSSNSKTNILKIQLILISNIMKVLIFKEYNQ